MKHARKRPSRGKPPNAANATVGNATAPLAVAAEAPPDLPFRLWLLAGATALCVARPLVPSEGVAWVGDGQPFCMLWLILAALTCLAAVRAGGLPRQPSWLDGLLLTFVTVYVAAAWRGCMLGTPRMTINMLWEGVALAVGFLLLRQLVWGARESRMLVAVMIALAVAISVDGLYQVFVSLPADRAEFARDPEGMLRRAGQWYPPGSPQRAAFENRLASTEPLATFALTNSLAGFLLPWITIAAGVALGTAFPRQRIGMVAATVLPAFCLLLTKSRSAYVALAVAVVLLLGNRFRQVLRARVTWVVGAVVLLAVAVTFVAGLLDVEIATEARKSLGYRLQYWQSSVDMIRDWPLLGVGPGNFQDYYTAYKLPEASEEIRDPHNWVLEIAAIAGIPAALLLCAFLVAAVVRLFRVAPSDPVPVIGTDGALRFIAAGAASGLLGASIAGALVGLPLGIGQLAMGAVIGGGVLWLLRDWLLAGTLAPRLLAIAVVAMLVHLLASGGLLFPGVAGSLWVLLALGLNLVEPSRVPSRRATAAIGLVVCGGLTVAQYLTGYSPVLRSQSAALDAQAVQDQLQQKEVSLHLAAEADPWSAVPWQELAALDLQRWLAKPGPRRLDQFRQATERLLQLQPHSSSAHRTVGNWWREIFARSGRPDHIRHAVQALTGAAALYPASAILRAELATALAAANEPKRAATEAHAALQLDAATPHQDKKLPEAMRTSMHQLAEAER